MEITYIVRLHPDQYAKIEREALGSAIVVNQQTTDLMAGYQLGIQHTLNILRKGWTVQE